jgi:hypothetical protein
LRAEGDSEEMTDPKPTTRAEWQKLYSAELEKRDRAEARYEEARERAVGAEKRVKEVTDQFNDLKQRLLTAEQANQFMRGYLARVQEDDTVREELLTIGDPDGEQHMVPKRKPTRFERPSDFTTLSASDQFGSGYISHDERRKPKHWITY